MTHVPTAGDLAARWRIALPAVAAVFAVSIRSLRLWPFLGALLVFSLWAGAAAGRRQVRVWQRLIDAGVTGGRAGPVEVKASAPRRLPPFAFVAAATLLALAASGTGGGAALAVWGSVVAAFGGWSFGRGTAVSALEADRGWTLHWPAGSCHRPGVPRLVAVAAPRTPRRRLYRWGLAAAAASSLFAAAFAVETLASVRAYATRPLPAIAAPSSASRIEPVFGRVASALAGRPVEVRCWSAADWPRVTVLDPVQTGGFADLGAGTVNLPPSVCGPLDSLAYSASHRFAYPTWEAIAAAHVLAHEAAHLGDAGTSESRAECDAVQTTERAAELLGADAAYARWMAALDWSHLYPRLPGSYRSERCAPGGPLDLHLAEGWPTPAGP